MQDLREELIKKYEALNEKQMQLKEEQASITMQKAIIYEQLADSWNKRQEGIYINPNFVKDTKFRKKMLCVRMQQINIEMQRFAVEKRAIKARIHHLKGEIGIR